jgi:RES domain-containing protein
LRLSARWHSKGRPIVYAAEHPAGALAEFLVHLDKEDFPAAFQLLTIKVDEDEEAETVDATELPESWQNDITATRAIGDAWLARGTSLLFRVPSVIVPHAHNMLINPAHAGAGKLRITQVDKVRLDTRLK